MAGNPGQVRRKGKHAVPGDLLELAKSLGGYAGKAEIHGDVDAGNGRVDPAHYGKDDRDVLAGDVTTDNEAGSRIVRLQLDHHLQFPGAFGASLMTVGPVTLIKATVALAWIVVSGRHGQTACTAPTTGQTTRVCHLPGSGSFSGSLR